ncbi:hypothetical protein [Kitasatospora aureofaciens]|uniref:hypothetical protein n=1 Tax=Kitasatospora aureofaciens TaxID=1894 RepID=UPI0037F84E5C
MSNVVTRVAKAARSRVVAGSAAALVLAMGAAAFAAPAVAQGNAGHIQVHLLTTGVNDDRNDPKVCQFYIDAFGFDAGETLTWEVSPGTFGMHGPPVAAGSATFNPGAGNIGQDISGPLNTDMGFTDGMFVSIEGNGSGEKHKEFKIDCGQPIPVAHPAVAGAAAAVAAPAAVGFFLWRRRRSLTA